MLLEMEGQQAARSLFELTDLTLDGFSPPPNVFFFDFFRLFGPAKSADESWGERISKSHLPLFFWWEPYIPLCPTLRAVHFSQGIIIQTTKEWWRIRIGAGVRIDGSVADKGSQRNLAFTSKDLDFTAGDVDVCNATGSWLFSTFLIFHDSSTSGMAIKVDKVTFPQMGGSAIRKSQWPSRRKTGWRISSSSDFSVRPRLISNRWPIPSTKRTSWGSWIAWTPGTWRREMAWRGVSFCMSLHIFDAEWLLLLVPVKKSQQVKT